MMNQMNMAGMNPAQGGPVGGGMMMMNNGAPATPPNSNTQDEMKVRLNTYIYDYFLNFGYHDLARALWRDEKFSINVVKQSPGDRKDGGVNGVDENSMDTDSKDDLIIPDDLPKPQVPPDSSCAGSAFLFDWFCLFNDVFKAQRSRKPNQRDVTSAHTYLEQTQTLQRMRETQQNAQLNHLQNPRMMGAQNQFAGVRGMRNGMMTQDMRAAALSKTMTPQQMQQFQQNKMMQAQQHQMQREHSDGMETNGHRPQSPADPDNVGSPSKRPRLGEQQFNGQMMPNGRGQGVPGVGPQGGMLMQTPLNGKVMGQGQFQGFAGPNQAMQQKLMQQGAMPNGMINPGVMANQGSPMLQPMSDNQFMGNMPMPELYGAQIRANGAMQGGPGGAGGGNHALQDYQMQLMLLEQQNKKRLMMARQEQDNISRDGGPMPGQPGMPPPGMSPSGSRTGNSPNPSDQMKRGTPQLGGLPGSPGPGDGLQQGRGSPASMNFMGGIPQDFNNSMLMKNGNDGMAGPGGPAMRPGGAMNPNNFNVEAMARAQQGRMPGGNWQAGQQGQPMMPQSSQGQPQPMGTPGQRSDMPPPQAPATGSANANRTQPSSPQPGQAPPTPSQSNKPAPKKKDKNEPRKRPNKKNSTANAPAASEPERATTPTPPTPVTPQHPNSFTGTNGKGPSAGNASVGNPAPTSNPSIPLSQQQIPPSDPSNGPFGDPNFPDQGFNLDFSGLESSDVLNEFDFDSFLNNTDDVTGAWAMDPNLNTDAFGLESTGVE